MCRPAWNRASLETVVIVAPIIDMAGHTNHTQIGCTVYSCCWSCYCHNDNEKKKNEAHQQLERLTEAVGPSLK